MSCRLAIAAETLIVHFSRSDLQGTAAPVVEGDELDVTAQKQRQAEGLSMAQKLFFIGAVVAVCILFVKTRRDQQAAAALREKSLA